jgi:Protein of unknown function (DUF732)
VTVAVAATVLSGCAATDGLMSRVALPNDRSSSSSAGAGDPATTAPGSAGTASSKLVVTGRQRAYLDALDGAGVQRSSDLMALQIGSYVCQARAAGQSSQGVWDFVRPLVAGDGHNPDVNAATQNYIRVATERLC